MIERSIDDDLVSEGEFASIGARARARPRAAGRAGTRGFVWDAREGTIARDRGVDVSGTRAIARRDEREGKTNPPRSRGASTRRIPAAGAGGRRTDLRGGQGRASEHGTSHGGGAITQKALHLLKGACGSRARRGGL
jgi:hypothetical protein